MRAQLLFIHSALGVIIVCACAWLVDINLEGCELWNPLHFAHGMRAHDEAGDGRVWVMEVDRWGAWRWRWVRSRTT